MRAGLVGCGLLNALAVWPVGGIAHARVFVLFHKTSAAEGSSSETATSGWRGRTGEHGRFFTNEGKSRVIESDGSAGRRDRRREE